MGIVEGHEGALGEKTTEAEEGEGAHEHFHHAAGLYSIVLCGGSAGLLLLLEFVGVELPVRWRLLSWGSGCICFVHFIIGNW